jgi:hypothetical protein
MYSSKSDTIYVSELDPGIQFLNNGPSDSIYVTNSKSLVLVSQINGSIIASVKFAPSSRKGANISADVKSALYKFPEKNKSDSQYFQGIMNADNQEFEFVVKNHTGVPILFTIFKDFTRINEINVLRPFESCTIQSDMNNDLPFILKKYINPDGSFITVRSDMESSDTHGTEFMISINAPKKSKSLIDLLKKTIWITSGEKDMDSTNPFLSTASRNVTSAINKKPFEKKLRVYSYDFEYDRENKSIVSKQIYYDNTFKTFYHDMSEIFLDNVLYDSPELTEDIFRKFDPSRQATIALSDILYTLRKQEREAKLRTKEYFKKYRCNEIRMMGSSANYSGWSDSGISNNDLMSSHVGKVHYGTERINVESMVSTEEFDFTITSKICVIGLSVND